MIYPLANMPCEDFIIRHMFCLQLSSLLSTVLSEQRFQLYLLRKGIGIWCDAGIDYLA